MKKGVYIAKQKNGDIYYRASINFCSKHISLGSYPDEDSAAMAYTEASEILYSEISLSEYTSEKKLSFSKWVSLTNFRDNRVYFPTPIYLKKSFFLYYIDTDIILTFDIEDLFFYANRTIQKRGGRLFYSEYGMQTTLKTRYGIKPYSVEGRDFIFINGNEYDYRYENLKILSHYTGVIPVKNKKNPSIVKYRTKIHIKSNYTVDTYDDEITAAIAYNKAVDFLKNHGINKNYGQNYIEDLSAKKYAEIYSSINIDNFYERISYICNQQS